jgi:hypothetical protein
VLSSCVQCNLAVSIRVASPGDDGDVTQSNALSSIASAANVADIAQTALASTPPVPTPFVVVTPAPQIPAPPEIPPPPVVSVPPGTVPTGFVRDVASAVPGALRPPGEMTVSTARRNAAAILGLTRVRAVVRHRRLHSDARTVVLAESHAYTRVVIRQSVTTRSSSTPAHKSAAAAGPPARGKAPGPRAPSAPSGPAAAGAVGAAAHDGGSSLLTAAIVAGLVLLALALLSTIVPVSLPIRRRLSDDRQARPG